MNIVVLAGGLSPERDVSLTSGSLVANALSEKGHRVLLADLYEGLFEASDFNSAYGKYSRIKYEYTVPEREPDLAAVRIARNQGDNSLIGENILPVCRDADMTFLALHGDIGENGKLQAVFDINGIRYTGTGYVGSLLAMDKPLSKELMRASNILTPDWFVFSCGDVPMALEAKSKITFPCVVKPCACGSSVGVSIVENLTEFGDAVKYAADYEKSLMAEKRIVGREFSVGVLGGGALPPIEIIPKQGFYDYRNKYQQGATLEECPPKNISQDVSRGLMDMAVRVHAALRLGDYSRIDMILDARGDIYCLEANTLPGMTPTSLLPQEAAAAGISYTELCERIITLASNRK